MENDPYTPPMPRPMGKPRPKQGHRLATLRKAAGLSQTELAKALGVSQQTVGLLGDCRHAPAFRRAPQDGKGPRRPRR